jgi:3-hydroxyisobutyrate dehydrogenase-like beta-hydroxyacid dehydrogenase
MSERIGFIGLGIMGARMARCLRQADFELTVWNRSREKALVWAGENDARVAASPAQLASECETVVTMVVDGAQVEEVLLGPDGVAAGAREGTLCVDMSTIAPPHTRSIGAALQERGVRMVDAPVSGSSPRAETGTLTIIVGGAPGDVEQARPLLHAMGELIVYAGPLGHGEYIKLINNAVAAANLATLAQALLLGRALDLDLDALQEAVSASSGASAMLDLKAKVMRHHDYTTLFKLDHMVKDIDLCLGAAEEAAVQLPSVSLTAEFFADAAQRGHGEDDFAAVLEALEPIMGLRL